MQSVGCAASLNVASASISVPKAIVVLPQEIPYLQHSVQYFQDGLTETVRLFAISKCCLRCFWMIVFFSFWCIVQPMSIFFLCIPLLESRKSFIIH